MRIAIMVTLFPPKWLAGTEIATYNIAKYLAKRGHEVHVITSLDEGLPKESIEEGFCVHRIFWRKIRFIGIMSFWMKIFGLLKSVNPDIIHVQSVGIGIPAFLSKKILKKPYVVYGRGSEIYLPWMFKDPISKLTLKNADAVIALTEDMKKEIKKKHSREVFVIPNGIDLERFKDLSRATIRKRLKIEDEVKIIIFVGSLRPVKGVRYLIEAMRVIRDKDNNIKLLLVGDGEEREYLEKLVEDLDLEKCVRFIGRVQNEEVPGYMAATDVFVLPSLSEGFPVAVVEAMGSGLPIIATKVGGLPEIIKNGEIDLIINTPEGSGARSDGYYLRTAAVMHNVPSITTLSAASAVIQGIHELRKNSKVKVKPIQEY